MKINVRIEIEDEELKKLFNLKSEEKVNPDNRIGERVNFSRYARFFDNSRVGWTKDPEYNLAFLKSKQDYCNNLLRSKGHLFLNEVYDILGIPRTVEGLVVGWVYNEGNPIGDNFIDFGLFDTNDNRNYDFINGYRNTVILDFNVDGDILNYI